MFQFLARIAGFLALAAAFAALVVDGTKSIAVHTVRLTPLSKSLRNLSPTFLPKFEQAVTRNVHPLLWDPVSVSVLRLPVWVVLAVLGAILLWLARRRPAPIGYTSRP